MLLVLTAGGLISKQCVFRNMFSFGDPASLIHYTTSEACNEVIYVCKVMENEILVPTGLFVFTCVTWLMWKECNGVLRRLRR